jgi:hypothetical protein
MTRCDRQLGYEKEVKQVASHKDCFELFAASAEINIVR